MAVLGCSGTAATDAGDERAADVPMFADIALDAVASDIASDLGVIDVGSEDVGSDDVGSNDVGTDVRADVRADVLADVRSSADAVADGSPCTSAGAYPAGPYGTAIGSVVSNYTWRGLTMPAGSAEPSTGALASVSLSEARGRGCRYAIVHLATPG